MTENTKNSKVTNKEVIRPFTKTVETKKTTKPVAIPRRMVCEAIANDMKSRIMGKLLGFADLFDPKTKTFLTEDELKAKGAVFIAVDYDKVLQFPGDGVKKSRETGEPTPFIRSTKKVLILANIYWESFINKRGHGKFIAAENRANGIKNSDDCRAIGEKVVKGFKRFYVCGVAFRVIEKTKYFDADGNQYPDNKALEAEYLNKPSQKSKQKVADNHGIELKFDPQYRTFRIDNCSAVKAFGFEYMPTD